MQACDLWLRFSLLRLLLLLLMISRCLVVSGKLDQCID